MKSQLTDINKINSALSDISSTDTGEINKIKLKREMKHNRHLLVARAVIYGKTYKQAGELVRVGAPRARQIFQQVIYLSIKAYGKSTGVVIPRHTLPEIRANKGLWLEVIAVLEAQLLGEELGEELGEVWE